MARDPWLDKYRTGSFRGVPFKTRAHTASGGRRKQDREFAKREVGNSEDLGKKLKTFSMDLYVIGSDYIEQRDALEEALDTPDAGELVHPYRGTIRVQTGTYSVTETVDEGRMARFTVEFTEAGEIKFPDIAADGISSAFDQASALASDSKSFFATVLDTVAQVAFVIQSAADDTRALVNDIKKAVSSVTDVVASVGFAIRNLNAAIDDLIQLPQELADQIEGVFNELLSVFEDEPETTERIMSAFLGGVDATVAKRPVVSTVPFDPLAPPPAPGDPPPGPDDPPTVEPTASRLTESRNQSAIVNLFKQLALSTQSKSVVEIEFASTAAALESRDEVVDGLDQQIDVTTGPRVVDESGDLLTDDDLYQTMKQLQTALTQAVPRTGTTELIEFTPAQTIPAIVIAHNLFEDLGKETEIVDQNAVEHPGFVPGGEIIEVSAG